MYAQSHCRCLDRETRNALLWFLALPRLDTIPLLVPLVCRALQKVLLVQIAILRLATQRQVIRQILILYIPKPLREL